MDDNLQEFIDPELYDAENQWAADDEFYLELAQQIGGPILDVACGTGRLTRAIAEAGLKTTGLDIMPPMLEQARRLSGKLDIEWIQTDCRTMQLADHFRLMLMTSHAFQNLLTDDDQNAFLEQAYAHLIPGGVLAFETRNLDGRSYYSGSGEERGHSFQDATGRWIDVKTTSKFDQATMIDHLFINRTIRETGETLDSKIALKYTPVDTLKQRLEDHGFTISELFGDWAKTPFKASSREIIVVCNK